MERRQLPRRPEWLDRDAAITDLAERFVCVPRHFFRFFTRPSAAYRRLGRLIAKKQLRVVGQQLIDDTGRPQTVICNGWRPTHLRHDVLVTDVLLAYPEATTICGPRVKREFRADGELSFPDGREFFLELDTGETSYRQHRRRQTVYKNLPPNAGVLFVTLGERRLKGIVEHIGPLAEVALFALYCDVMTDPYAAIWQDAAGHKGALTKPAAAADLSKNRVEKT